eukprot:15468198-Alexandrium_andersonii.AAC.1
MCPGCRRHQANLCLTAHAPRRGDIVVDATPQVAGRCHLEATLFATFDGAGPSVTHDDRGGAGAVVWRRQGGAWD